MNVHLSPEQKQIVADLYPRAVRIARSLCPRDDDAEDAAVDQLISAVVRWKPGGLPISDWALFCIFRRMRGWKKKQRMPNTSAEGVDHDNGPDLPLDVLPPDLRWFIEGFLSKGCDPKAYAKGAGISLRTVYRRLDEVRSYLEVQGVTSG